MAKKMKKIDLSCASPASTAICSSLDQRSMIKTSTKSLHRLNSYLGDHYKTLTNNNNSSYYSASPRAPCISELPFTPRPSSFSAYRDKTRKLAPSSFSYGVNHSDVLMSRRRRSSADIADIKRHTTTTTNNNNNINNIKKNKHIYGSGDSSRYLLGESRYLDSLSGNEYTKIAYNNNNNTTTSTTSSSSPVYGRCEGAARKSTSGMERRRFGTMLDAEKEKIRKHFSLIDVGDDQSKHINNNTTTTTTTTCVDGRLSQSQRQMQRSVASPSPSPSTYANDSLVHVPNKPPSPHQVVVLRVSLHCKGCENKLRKHLSKLPGVASYNIDMETKKVTVTGNVTPYEMLTSISKVKNAQFWPSQASSTSTSSSSSSTSSTIDLN